MSYSSLIHDVLAGGNVNEVKVHPDVGILYVIDNDGVWAEEIDLIPGSAALLSVAEVCDLAHEEVFGAEEVALLREGALFPVAAGAEINFFGEFVDVLTIDDVELSGVAEFGGEDVCEAIADGGTGIVAWVGEGFDADLGASVLRQGETGSEGEDGEYYGKSEPSYGHQDLLEVESGFRQGR